MLQSIRGRIVIVPLLFNLMADVPARAAIDIKPTHANGEVTAIVEFEVKPGFEAEFEAGARRSITCSRLEPGAVVFDIHRLGGDGVRYVLYEVWRSPEALQSHFERPYTKALFAMFDRALVKPVAEGGFRPVSELLPAPRPAPTASDPVTNPECR